MNHSITPFSFPFDIISQKYCWGPTHAHCYLSGLYFISLMDFRVMRTLWKWHSRPEILRLPMYLFCESQGADLTAHPYTTHLITATAVEDADKVAFLLFPPRSQIGEWKWWSYGVGGKRPVTAPGLLCASQKWSRGWWIQALIKYSVVVSLKCVC